MDIKLILQLTIVLIWLTFANSSVFSENRVSDPTYLSCLKQPEKQKSRSKELEDMVLADQKERVDFENLSEEERLDLVENDLIRRKRVGEILGEGCFKTAQDYAGASLIYQHGDVPDHYFQAFIWAMRAVELGDEKQTQLVALTIDRYLVSIGKKQLFGSQLYASEATQWCFCMEPTEDSFPDSRRKEYTGYSLQDRYDWLVSMNIGKSCSNSECTTPLQPSPKESIPGFW
jgi:hypothetical protein